MAASLASVMRVRFMYWFVAAIKRRCCAPRSINLCRFGKSAGKVCASSSSNRTYHHPIRTCIPISPDRQVECRNLWSKPCFQPVLLLPAIDDPAFHHERDMFDSLYVLQRISCDRNDVGSIAGFERAYFPLPVE